VGWQVVPMPDGGGGMLGALVLIVVGLVMTAVMQSHHGEAVSRHHGIEHTFSEALRVGKSKLRVAACVAFVRIQKRGGNHAKINLMGGRCCGCFVSAYDDRRSRASWRYPTTRLA
jgi:hypothetical protein